MLGRCHNPAHPKFEKYGAVGIFVCDRWRAGFENFLEDMGERPKGTTIDRVESSRGYEPGNCRWATGREQQSNISINRWIEFDGRRQILADWARELGVGSGVLCYRLSHGWSIQDALTKRPWGRIKTPHQ